MSELSVGQQLLHNKKLEQASCFLASNVPMEKRLEWSDSFPKKVIRRDCTKLKDTSLFLVLSQNCDIACRQDHLDSAVELVVCKKIREKDVSLGSSFVKSVRRLHFKAADNWYEANVDYILTVEKPDLFQLINTTTDFELITLSDEYIKSIPLWRSNRYQRSALPDAFNNQLEPVLKNHLADIEDKARATEAGISSYIRAIYIWLSSQEELGYYEFEIFALMRDETENSVLTDVQDAIEEMATELAQNSGFQDESSMYADRAKNTYISYLTRFVRLNLDSHSLANGDDDTGPED